MDHRRHLIRRSVAELVAVEGSLAGRLERAQRMSRRYPDALVAIQHFQAMVHANRDQLVTYLIESGAVELGEEMPTPRSTAGEAIALSELLRDLCLAFHHCALSYAMLFELALRLYEPRLREIAPEHLKAHVDAALSTARLLPGVVAWQLDQEGLHCACICPMCSLGACGCVAYGTDTLTAAWRDAAPTESETPGFVLQPPKPGSQLARAGVEGGELVLAIDDQQVRGFAEIQAAIRKHAQGDELCLLIQRNSQSPRGLNVRHVSDYPKT